jgi:hypothetical protein
LGEEVEGYGGAGIVFLPVAETLTPDSPSRRASGEGREWSPELRRKGIDSREAQWRD